MDSDCGSYLDQKPKLALKSSQIHVERLKKLKQKLSFQTPQMSHYTPSRRQSFINTKFTISRSTNNNLNPFDQSFKRQQNTAPNKSNYFQSMNLKNIQSQNKILYKKIQKIVKRKTTNLIAQQRNQQRKSNTSFDNYQETVDNDVLNVTSDLAEDMIKNRATRSMIKQQEIRNQNIKMLQRLMSLKPTIQTRKILNQTRKQQQISKRMSKFNSFHTMQLQKSDPSKDQEASDSIILLPKRLSVDNKHHNNRTRTDLQYEIPIHLTKKQHISNYHQRTQRLMPESPAMFKRTNTQPIESLQNIKLPTLSPKHTTNVYSFNSRQKSNQEIRKRARSQNLKYLETSKSFSSQKKPQFQTTSFGYRSNSAQHFGEGNDSGQMNLFKARKALEKQKVMSDKQINKSSPKKFILLGQIEKKVQNLNVRFRFVRFNCYYEIQIREKKVVKKDKNSQKGQQISTKSKPSNSLTHQPIASSQPLGLKKVPYQKTSKLRQTSSKKLKFPGSIISLDQEMGSALFSSYDYDYHRIVQKCLRFDIGKDNVLNIGMKEELQGCSRKIISYQQDSIRENDQDEEEDSQDSVRQE